MRAIGGKTMTEHDPYWKLKPAPATPQDEICSCETLQPIILCYDLGDNPLRCFECNKEIQPERLRPSESLVDAIASWRSFYGSIYLLWLDSKEFEDWATKRLSDPHSPPNERGYEICKRLSEITPCYFWWFQDNSVEDFEPIDRCPKCGALLTKSSDRLICKQCLIVVAN